MRSADARRSILLDALENVDGERPTITSCRLASGGNSHENWIFDLRRKCGPARLVLRCDPDDWIRPDEMEREVLGLKIAAAVGVPAPRLVASHHDRPADRPYTIVNFVEGESIPRRVHREPALGQARRDFARQCGAIIGRLAAAPPEVARGLEPRDPIATLHGWYGRAEAPEPVLAGAIVWLQANAPPKHMETVVHGDFRLGNLIVAEDGVRAVLDWETAHLGDPHEDLAWLCQRAWRYGGAAPVGGIGDLEDLFSAFEQSSGGGVDVERFHWWLLWGATWWALVCREQATARRDRAGDHMESAAVGRLVSLQARHVLAELERWVR